MAVNAMVTAHVTFNHKTVSAPQDQSECSVKAKVMAEDFSGAFFTSFLCNRLWAP